MPKSLILFDIDRTLINTDLLRKLMRKTLAEAAGRTEDEIADCFLEYYGSLDDTTKFHPEEFLTFLAGKYRISREKLADAFYQSPNYQQVLYPEAVEVLSQLRNQGYILGLYSQGRREYQEHKMLANNLMDFFDKRHIYISAAKMDPAVIENLPENTVIIDDRPDVIEFLEKFPNVIPLHIVRDEAVPYGEYTLSDLRGLFPVLDSLSHP